MNTKNKKQKIEMNSNIISFFNNSIHSLNCFISYRLLILIVEMNYKL